MKLLFLVVLSFLSLGCQSIATNSTKVISTADLSLKGGKNHIIGVEVGEELKAFGPDIKLSRHVRFGIEYIHVSGSVRKILGRPSLEGKRVNIRFIDADGKIVKEDVVKMKISRLRPPTPSKVKFSLKVPYSVDIIKCAVSLE